MKKLRRSLVLVVVAVAAMVAPTVPAAADPGSVAAEFTGSGNFSPGITALPSPQLISIEGIMAGAFVAGINADTATLNCAFSGTITGSVAETMSLGAQCNGSGVVTGMRISLTCTFTATITHPPLCIVLTGLCALTVGSIDVKVIVVLRLCLVPTDGPSPVTSFTANGELLGAGT